MRYNIRIYYQSAFPYRKVAGDLGIVRENSERGRGFLTTYISRSTLVMQQKVHVN